MDNQQLFDARDGVEADEVRAEAWLKTLDEVNATLDTERPRMFDRVRIAILDTGIDMTNDCFNNAVARPRIKKRVDFLPKGPLSRTDAHDECGHGSHCAGLLRRVAPAADIYVARVAKGFDTDIDPQVVAKAIDCACMEWDVDIITMSFGFESRHDLVQHALLEALKRDKIVFAAASNSGIRKLVAFPARMSGIWRNPPLNLAILGENVRSAWISSQPNAAMHDKTKVKSGSSIATPIAAGCFSLLLEVAKNPHDDDACRIFDYYEGKMRNRDAVQIILGEASENCGDHRVVGPEFFKKVKDRREFAYWIQSTLSRDYGRPGASETGSKSGQVLAHSTIPPSLLPRGSRAATAPPIPHERRPPPATSNSAPVPTRAGPCPGLFYTLDSRPTHIHPTASYYWGHLTAAAYGIYERIYEDCKDRVSGLVDYNSFAGQFNGTDPEPIIVESVWALLFGNRDPGNIADSVHPKGLTIAALYMLHLRRFRPKLLPPVEKKEGGLSRWRLQRLECFGSWVRCRCSITCAVQWNFADDVGLHSGGNPNSCRLYKFIYKGKTKLLSSKSEQELRDETVLEWENSAKR